MSSRDIISALYKCVFTGVILIATSATSHAGSLSTKSILTRGECNKSQTVMEALGANGQYEIVTAQSGQSDSWKWSIFTTNLDYSIGFRVETSGREGNDEVCVTEKFTNIRLNRDRFYKIPPWARVKIGSPRDEFLDKLESSGDGELLFTANALFNGADGVERVGAFLMLVRNSKLDGGFNVSRVDGSEIADLAILINVVPTDNYRVLTGRLNAVRPDLHPTLSELDSMPWAGNPEDIWTVGRTTASRRSLYEAARKTRSTIRDLAERNQWSEQKRIQEEMLIINYMKSIKSR